MPSLPRQNSVNGPIIVQRGSGGSSDGVIRTKSVQLESQVTHSSAAQEGGGSSALIPGEGRNPWVTPKSSGVVPAQLQVSPPPTACSLAINHTVVGV